MKPAHSVAIEIPLPQWLRVPVAFAKDLHILLPITLGGLAVMLVARLAPEWLDGTYLVAYLITCSALGAIAAGHDFTYRTAGWMLSLPISRRKIWSRRLLLVAALMLPLTLLVFKFMWRPAAWSASPSAFFQQFAIFVCAPALGGLCLAPWLTLISRSPMFGTVLSLGTPFAVLGILFRLGKPELFYAVMAVLWIAGFILGARKFMTLEIIDGAPSVSFALLRVSAECFRRRGPIAQLFKKELMLQRHCIWPAIISMTLALLFNEEYAKYWTLGYPAILVLIIASTASAHERQIGTAEWQVLVPVPFWKQWLIKFTVTWGLAVVVGLVLPIAILFFKTGDLQKLGSFEALRAAMLWPTGSWRWAVPLFLSASFLSVVITLYISSLCNSGLKAILTAMVVNVFAALAIAQMVFYVHGIVIADAVAEAQAAGLLQPEIFVRRTWSLRGNTWFHREYGLFLIALLGLVGLAFHFSMNNHRFAERGPRRILRQLAAFAAYQVIATICLLTVFGWIH